MADSLVKGSYGVGVLKVILLDRDSVGCKILFKVGNGRRVHF